MWIEGIGHDARSLASSTDPPLRQTSTGLLFSGVPSPGPPVTHGTGLGDKLAEATLLRRS